jgi:hypothetical protein
VAQKSSRLRSQTSEAVTCKPSVDIDFEASPEQSKTQLIGYNAMDYPDFDEKQ